MICNAYRKTHKRVRPEQVIEKIPLTDDEKIARKAVVLAHEKRIAAALALEYRTPYERCICGILVYFRETTKGWWWQLAVWRGNSYRKTVPPKGPYPKRSQAVKEAARFVSGVVGRVKGTNALIGALCEEGKTLSGGI